MALEDFEKALAAEKKLKEESASGMRSKEHRHHRSHRHHLNSRDDNEDEHHRKRRRRSSEGDGERNDRHQRSDDAHPRPRRQRSRSAPSSPVAEKPTISENPQSSKPTLKRDAWMEAPSQAQFEVRHRRAEDLVEPITIHSAKADFELKVHRNELNKHHLEDPEDRSLAEVSVEDEPLKHEVDYIFGDSGSNWRMTRLRGVYRRADETGEALDEAALKQYGDLHFFDDAREEETELDRRKMYGEGYVGKEKPSGDLFQERKMKAGIRRKSKRDDESDDEAEISIRSVNEEPAPNRTVALDQTALNRLKAQMMKAKLRRAPEATQLEEQYEAALSALANDKQPDVIVLGKMENRMLAGGREGEVKRIENRRGRERGLVEENDDMSIGDMVREERRTKGEGGGEGKRFAERIAKDGKFDDDLEYMDENASKLAKRIQKSEINLRNTAISDLKKTSRALDNCPLCHHEDIGQPPVAPVVALGTRTYLTLPTEPEISPGGACIVPIEHRKNLLECDDDEWEEIRNFMKALTRMYASRKLGVLFYENAARPELQQHAMLAAVPAPQKDAATAPGFFREAILQEATEWAQHRKIIDTGLAAKNGLGRTAFRRSLAKEMPYFHVWFTLDGGLGHIVEDSVSWPKGDLFAREVLGGVLQKDFETVRGRGRWIRGDRRVDLFQQDFDTFDWTKMLIEDEK